MAEKKRVKKRREKKPVETLIEEEPLKKVIEKENSQLIWFIVFIVVAFLAFLIPYLYFEGLKSFEYEELKWSVEDYSGITAYHTRFRALDGRDLNYNVYLREDPRENNVSTAGTFNLFKKEGYVSFSPQVDACRGDVARVMLDLGNFLKLGVGISNLITATNDLKTSEEIDRPYVTCASLERNNMAIIVDIGEESAVSQSAANPYCYVITVEDCNDISPVEKFIVKSTTDIMASSL